MKNRYLIIVIRTLKSLKSYNDLKIFIQKMIHQLEIHENFHFYYKIPLIVQIEPTNYCNINCICCSTTRSSRKKGFMEFDLFKKIINEVSEIRVKKIYLFLHGEPLLHPRLIEMVRYIKSNDLGVNIYTNGSLLDKEKSDALLRLMDCNDTVTFSILGYSKDVHERIMKGINHEKVLKNISDFLDLRKRYESYVTVDIVFLTTPENEHEKTQFIKYWYKKVDAINISTAKKSFSEYKRKKIDTTFRTKTCNGLWERLSIFWNGDVTFCNLDIDGDYVIGNLKEQSIKEIWNGKYLSTARRLHRKKHFQEIPLCANCDM